jgi:hypothetical protein
VVAYNGDPRERGHQGRADAQSTRGGIDEQVLEVEPGPGEERRVAREEQREA